MKLKIKETGELLEDVKLIDTTLNKVIIQYLDNGVLRECVVKNLSDVEEVKDYKERKVGYIIDPMEEDCVISEQCPGYEESDIERAKECGLYFETKEEAEKAVEKLKAWKRLKDKGFRFIDHIDRDCGQGITRYEWDGYIDGEDLDLLFGGENE